jgi:anti-anti-sigma factor
MEAHIRDDDEHLIRISGEIDLATSAQLLCRLFALTVPAYEHYTLDLTKVTFLDCSGLRSLLALGHHLAAHGGAMQVGAVSLPVGRLLELLPPHGLPPGFLPASSARPGATATQAVSPALRP